MKIIFCVAVLIALAAAAPGTYYDLGKVIDRTVYEFIPKTDEERARDALNNAEEDLFDAFEDFISGGGDYRCNAAAILFCIVFVAGYAKHQRVRL